MYLLALGVLRKYSSIGNTKQMLLQYLINLVPQIKYTPHSQRKDWISSYKVNITLILSPILFRYFIHYVYFFLDYLCPTNHNQLENKCTKTSKSQESVKLFEQKETTSIQAIPKPEVLQYNTATIIAMHSHQFVQRKHIYNYIVSIYRVKTKNDRNTLTMHREKDPKYKLSIYTPIAFFLFQRIYYKK